MQLPSQHQGMLGRDMESKSEGCPIGLEGGGTYVHGVQDGLLWEGTPLTVWVAYEKTRGR